jgi:outer membrane lipoprotein-sorting protein
MYGWEKKIANATETSKKKAEEKAAQRAFYILNKKENILGNPKLYDLDDIEFEDIAIGLVRLAKDIPDHEFFYKINQNNDLTFSRKRSGLSRGLL